MQAIIMARVSSEEQRYNSSLEGQLAGLKEYCRRKNLDIIAERAFVESSVKKKRKNIEEILDLIKCQKECTALVVFMVDRLQRDYELTPTIDDLTRKKVMELHFVNEGLIINENPLSADRMHWDAMVFSAKMSNRMRLAHSLRGRQHSLDQGHYPYGPPMGYKAIRNTRTDKRTLVVDKPNAKKIKKLFELYATGNYSIRQLEKLTRSMKIKIDHWSGSPEVTKRNIGQVLKNPFYIGYMRSGGTYYKHHYETFIDEDVFQRCQLIIKNRAYCRDTKTPFNQGGEYGLINVIRCGQCGSYTRLREFFGKFYYYCTRRHTDSKILTCRENSLRKEKLEGKIFEALEKIYITPEKREFLEEYLSKEFPTCSLKFCGLIEQSKRTIGEIESRINTLLDMRVSGEIPADIFKEKFNLLSVERIEEKEKLHAIYATDHVNDKLSSFLDYASNAPMIFKNGTTEEKRTLIVTIFNRIELHGKSVIFTYNPAFAILSSMSNLRYLKKAIGECREALVQDILTYDKFIKKGLLAALYSKPLTYLPPYLEKRVEIELTLKAEKFHVNEY